MFGVNYQRFINSFQRAPKYFGESAKFESPMNLATPPDITEIYSHICPQEGEIEAFVFCSLKQSNLAQISYFMKIVKKKKVNSMNSFLKCILYLF